MAKSQLWLIGVLPFGYGFWQQWIAEEKEEENNNDILLQLLGMGMVAYYVSG